MAQTYEDGKDLDTLRGIERAAMGIDGVAAAHAELVSRTQVHITIVPKRRLERVTDRCDLTSEVGGLLSRIPIPICTVSVDLKEPRSFLVMWREMWAFWLLLSLIVGVAAGWGLGQI